VHARGKSGGNKLQVNMCVPALTHNGRLGACSGAANSWGRKARRHGGRDTACALMYRIVNGERVTNKLREERQTQTQATP
jgi:hypothetical protein